MKTIAKKEKHIADIEFLQRALKHTQSELKRVHKYIKQMDVVILERNKFFKTIPNFNMYDDSKESKRYWQISSVVEEKESKSNCIMSRLVSFAMELERMYKKRRLKDLFDLKFGYLFKQLVLDVLFIPYPVKYSVPCYRFRASWLGWIGFEWVDKKGWYYQGVKYNAW